MAKIRSKLLDNLQKNVNNEGATVKALFDGISELVEPLAFVQQHKAKILQFIDTDQDGKISPAEFQAAVRNPLLWKWILIVLATIIISTLANVFTSYVFYGEVDFSTLGIVAQVVVAPFTMGILQKSTMDDYDNRLKEKDRRIEDLLDQLRAEKGDHDQDIKKAEIAAKTKEMEFLSMFNTEREKWSNELHQKELALELKTQFINDWTLRNGGKKE